MIAAAGYYTIEGYTCCTINIVFTNYIFLGGRTEYLVVNEELRTSLDFGDIMYHCLLIVSITVGLSPET